MNDTRYIILSVEIIWTMQNAAVLAFQGFTATLKILIIGDASVGKTSLLVRFCDDTFEPKQLPTVAHSKPKVISFYFIF